MKFIAKNSLYVDQSINQSIISFMFHLLKESSMQHVMVYLIKAGDCAKLLVHGQVTIIFIVSVCLFVCLFVCAEFFSAVFDPISIKLGHVICLGLVVSSRI